MKPCKPFFMALLGTFVEYYDYALYGFSAPILAHHFFPQQDPLVALLQIYGIFIAGSCAKPLGSLIFGYLGDRYGRAFSLKISICGIALPTLCIGILPDFNHIGYFAPISLFLCRILQGIFVSGESDTARVFLYEMLPKKHRCFSNSMAYFICMIGIYIASVVSPTFSTGFVNSSIGGFTIDTWRIPFLFGGILGLLMLFLRRNLQESELFLATQRSLTINIQTLQKGHRKLDFIAKRTIEFLKDFINFPKNGRAIFITLLMTGAAGGQYHFYFVFLNQYLSQMLKQCDATVAAYSTSNLLLCFALLLPLAGLLADRLSQKLNFNLARLLKVGNLFLLFLAAINVFYVSKGVLPMGIMLFTVLGLSFTHANTFVVILDQFETSERCRGASIGHALGSMLLSGSTPFISLWLWRVTHWETAPLLYFLMLCVISYVALLLLNQKSTAQKHVTDDSTTKDLLLDNGL